MEFSYNLLVCRFMLLKPDCWHLNYPMRPYWRLYWVDRSGCVVRSGGKAYELTPDTVTLIAPDTYFEGAIAAPLNQFFIHFTCDGLFDTSALSIHQVREGPWIREFGGQVLQRPNIGLRRTQVPFLLQAISNAMASIPAHFVQTESRDPRLEKVVTAMKSIHVLPLSNEELAEIAGMSKRSFLRFFKERIGVTPQAWYLRQRLERAMMELEFSARSIDEIAAGCGFCDRNYFSAVFRKHLSSSPAEYRCKSRQ